MTTAISRRTFITAAVAAATATAFSTPKLHAAQAAKGPCVCVFSKHLPFLDWAGLGKTAKDIGLDGIDLTVREGGHVLPEKVADDLPRAVEAIRAAGVEVPMITTRLFSGSDPDAKPILQAAAKAGIGYARIGGQMYKEGLDPLKQLSGFTEEVKTLTQIAQDAGITLGYHNHSGYQDVGAPMWDLIRMFESIGSPRLGVNLDVGHARVEGAYGAWRTNLEAMAPFVKMMAVKDFIWKKDKPEWVPLGKGIVDTAESLAIMRKQANFAGPISLHFEYKIDGNDAVIEEIRAANTTLRNALKNAGYV